jgi:D-lactate dehydrogenase
MRVPAYSPQAIAEHATALILSTGKTHKAYRVREKIIFSSNLMVLTYLEKQLEL